MIFYDVLTVAFDTYSGVQKQQGLWSAQDEFGNKKMLIFFLSASNFSCFFLFKDRGLFVVTFLSLLSNLLHYI